MYFKSTIQLSLKRLFLLVILFYIGFVRSEIARQNITTDTCQTTTYLNVQMYQCELTLHADDPWQKLMLNFNYLELNCSDTLYISEGSTVSEGAAFKLTCENETGTMIYSSTDSITLKYVTADSLGFNSNDFVLAYAPFHDARNGCDGFVCKDDEKYCISSDFVFDRYFQCEDRTDELSLCLGLGVRYDRIRLVVYICIAVAGFMLLLGIVWICSYNEVCRNRAVINRNDGNLNEKLSLF